MGWAEKCTAEFRAQETLRWQRVAERLREEAGVEPKDAALVDFAPDGPGTASGLVGTRDERLFEFSIVLGERAPGDRTGSIHDGYLYGWRELEKDQIDGIYFEGLATAQELLANEQPEG